MGTRTVGWLAGPRGLPGHVNPPPNRPVLILIDFSPLQALTHRSEPDREHYMAMASSNFRNVSGYELEALFTWSRQMEPVEAGLIPTGELRFCISKRLRSQWDIQIDPSNLEFRFCDLDGDTFQVSNDMTILQLLEEYRPEWRLRQYNSRESSLLIPGTTQPFVLRLQCHKISPGVILPWYASRPKRPCCRVFNSPLTPHQHKGFFDFHLIWLWALASPSQLNHLIEHWTSLLLLLLVLSFSGFAYLCNFWCLSLCCTISRISDRFTHGAQTRRDRGGLGLAFESYPWTHSYQPSSSTRRPGFCSMSFWPFWPSYQHHFGTFDNWQYSSWAWKYGPFWYILRPRTSWCPVSAGAQFYTQLPPSCSLLFPRGSPDPIQDHYPLQQHQGAIYWRDPLVRAFQMSWSWTLLLWSFGQLGVVPAHSGLLATSFWNSSSTWTSPFSQCSHWDHGTYGGNPLYSDDPGLGPTTFNHFEGCYGIWGNQRHVEDAWGHELPWRDRNTSSWDEPPFWVTEHSYVH